MVSTERNPAGPSSVPRVFVDTWFDVLASSTQGEPAAALAEGVLVERPLAFVCLRIARGAERRVEHGETAP